MMRSFELFPYQRELCLEIESAFKQHQGVFFVLPTGGGKTVVFSELIRRFLERKPSLKVIIVAHTIELLDQISKKLKHFNVPHGVIQAKRNTNPDASIQVCSIWTICDQELPFSPDLIVIDEAHLSPAASYRKVMDRYPAARRLLVSATPLRSDGQGFLDIASVMVMGPSVSTLQHQSYLVDEVEYRYPERRTQEAGTELDPDEMNERSFESARRKEVVDTYLRCNPRPRKTLTFAISQAHAFALREDFVSAGIKAEVLTSMTPARERQKIMKDFQSGHLDMLVVVEIASEGLDVPDIDAVMLTKSIKSLTVYLQQIGRGMRIAQGKERLVVFDFGFNVWRFGGVARPVEWTLDDSDPVDYWQPRARHRPLGEQGDFSPERLDEVRTIHQEELKALKGKRTQLGKPYSLGFAFYQAIKRGCRERELVVALSAKYLPYEIKKRYKKWA